MLPSHSLVEYISWRSCASIMANSDVLVVALLRLVPMVNCVLNFDALGLPTISLSSETLIKTLTHGPKHTWPQWLVQHIVVVDIKTLSLTVLMIILFLRQIFYSFLFDSEWHCTAKPQLMPHLILGPFFFLSLASCSIFPFVDVDLFLCSWMTRTHIYYGLTLEEDMAVVLLLCKWKDFSFLIYAVKLSEHLKCNGAGVLWLFLWSNPHLWYRCVLVLNMTRYGTS